MKNVIVYVGTIKKCLNYRGYKKDGDTSFVPLDCISTNTTKIVSGIEKSNVETINDQAILIKHSNNHFYEFKLTNTFKENLKIIFGDLDSAIKLEPESDGDLFLGREAFPYYEEQPKRLSLRKLRMDLLMDPRIKSGIEH